MTIGEPPASAGGTPPPGAPQGPLPAARLDAALSRVEDALVLVSAASLFIIMASIVFDVLLRYGFNAPLTWTYELITHYLLPVAFFFALAQTMRFNEHITVDVFLGLLNPLVLRLSIAAGLLLAAFIFAAMAYISGAEAWHSYITNERMVAYYVWPTWPPKITVAIGAALLAARLLLRVYQNLADIHAVGQDSTVS